MGARRRSDTTSRQDTTGCCQATLNHRDATGRGNRRQDAGDAGDAKTTSLTSKCNPCASDPPFIFADAVIYDLGKRSLTYTKVESDIW